jgi:hypothetical protein
MKRKLIIGECNSRKWQSKNGREEVKRENKMGRRREINWKRKRSREGEQVKSFVTAIPCLNSSRKNVTPLQLTRFWKGQRTRISLPGICSHIAFLFRNLTLEDTSI